MQRRKTRGQARRLRSFRPLSAVEVLADNRVMVNFSANDYLGLSKHPLLEERAGTFMAKYGTGATASRLVCGSYDCFDLVEEKLAALTQAQSILILGSGFQANVSILPALCDKNALILSDQLNHNSIIQGTLLSRCQKVPFRHNDLDHLASLLKTHHPKGHSRIVIVTESLFSMDGDTSDMDALVALAGAYNALLVVDDAHATGVLGENGMGLTCGKKVDLVISTFSKAMGSFGAFAACSEEMRAYLVNRCAGLIYSTAMPPQVLGAVDAALDLVPGMDKEREDLAGKAMFLRKALHDLGYDTGNSTTHIIPVVIGDERETLAISEKLEQAGYLAVAIRPPTVPKGQSRIRLTLSAAHTREQIQGLIHFFSLS